MKKLLAAVTVLAVSTAQAGVVIHVDDDAPLGGDGLMKRAEQVSRDSEARLRGILENSPIGVAVIDEDNMIRFHNPRFPEVLGGAGEDLVGTSSTRFWTDKKEREKSMKQFRERVAGMKYMSSFSSSS